MAEKKKEYKKSELCKLADISPSTYHRWERQGLLPQPKRDGWRNWRVFTDEDLKAVLKIRDREHRILKPEKSK